MDKICALALAAVQQEPSNYLRLNTLGAALYRAGKYPEAIKCLNDAREACQADRASRVAHSFDRVIRTPVESASPGRAQDWVFIAMAQARLKNSADAKTALKTAQDLSVELAPPGSDTLHRRSWSAIELGILVEEATQLIEPTVLETP